MPFPSVEDQLTVFRRGVVDLIDAEDLGERLGRSRAEGRPLRIKFGMDPSSADLHVGHAVQLRKLAALQRLGHTIVLIVGDSTAMVGDPSGRNKLRPQLSREAVEANLGTYVEQARLVLDVERAEVHRNSEWFDAMRFEDVLRLAGKMTVARMLERDTFETRMRKNEPIGIHEFIYPLMQGWDSVEIRSDLELGGTDQLFNLLVGRQLQEREGQPGQICMTMPLIDGLDGRKMSKSYDNAIGLTDAPNDVFGKTMSLADDGMRTWFELLTDVDEAEIDALIAGHPRDAKARLGREICASLYGSDAARAAADAFDRQFKAKEVPDDVPEHRWPAGGDELPLPNLLKELGLAQSTSEARRLVQQGGVKLDGQAEKDPRSSVARDRLPVLIQVGKRRFAKLV